MLGVVVSLVFAACVFGSSLASAQALPIAHAEPGQLRVDGELGEWRGVRMQKLGSDAAGALDYALAYTNDGLYLAARVRDDNFVRSAQPSPREDALVLALAFPEHERWSTRELWLYAGQTGQTRAVLMLAADGGEAHALSAGSSIVEAPASGGYTLEAYVPWSALGATASWAFARGALRLHDVDDSHAQAGNAHELATAGARGASLPWLMFEAGAAPVWAAFLRDKQLSAATPKLDVVTALRADGQLRRVLVIGSYVVVGGTDGAISFDDLPVSSAAGVHSAELVDLTGDHRPELVLRLEQSRELGTREVFTVFDLQAEHPRALGAIVVREQRAGSVIDAQLELGAAHGAARELVVRTGRAQGVSADSYQADPDAEVEPLLLPWDASSERVYAWNGTRLAVVRERPNPHAKPQLGSTASASKAGPGAERARDAAPVTQTPTVLVPVTGTSAELLAAYRAARGVSNSAQPSFSERIDLAGDARPETVQLLGSELVVVGEGFRGGTGFFYFGLPVQDPSDVLHAFSADVTGDRHRELFVRVRQHLGDVQRDILLGYSFVGEALQPIVAVEVRRVQAGSGIANLVSLISEHRHWALQIEPGLAQGWTASSYPFETSSNDATLPLLLPWRDRPVRYRYDGVKLADSAQLGPRHD